MGTSQKTFSGSLSSQPKALYVLALVELWERFSYYGIRVLLILYMTSQLGFRDEAAYGIYGMYFALVSAATVAGGYIADKFIGHQMAIYFGGVLIAIGHIFLMCSQVEGPFYSGLGFIATGTGFFKGNITTLLGQHYQTNDPRRDSGFTIFYMGINIGAFLAPFICGYVGRVYGWQYGFGISGAGIVLGLVIFYRSNEMAGINILKFLFPKVFTFSRYHLVILASLASIPLFSLCIHYHEIMKNFLHFFGIGLLCILVSVAFRYKGDERKSLLTLIIMIPFFVAFWTSFEQAGASVNLFIDRHVNKEFMGYTLETTWFQALTPFFIITLGPLFSWLWVRLSRHNLEPITPVKFALALLQVSLSFWFLKLAVDEGTANSMTSMVWVILAYFFRTTGELCLSPIALSMVTKLAPQGITSFMMGTFFLSIAFAQLLAQQIAVYFTAAGEINQEIKIIGQLHDPATSFLIFRQIFEFLIYLPLGAGILMLLISPLLKGVFKKHR